MSVMTAETTVPAVPMPFVWRVTAVGLVSAFAAMLVYPAAVAALAARGVSASAIGLFAVLQPAAMIALIPCMPWVERRIGRIAAIRLALVMGAAAIAVMVASDNVGLWLLASMLMGVQFAVHWTSIDTALSENVPKHKAGRVIGLYQTLLAAGVATGPAVVTLFALPFQAAALVGCALILVSLGATLGEVGTRIDAAAAALRRPTLSPARFARTHAGLAAAAVLAGIFEVGTSAMATVHALHLGFSAPAAVFAAAVIAGGSLVAQLPAGWLADRVGLPTLMRACGLGMAASAAALPLADSAPLVFWVLTALWGAFGGALQTLVYLSVAKSRDSSAVGPAMAVLAIGCTLGSLIGPGLGGIAMDLSPSLGLALALTLSAAVLTVVVGRRR